MNEERHIGKFRITSEEQKVFEDNPHLLDRLMRGLFILRAEFLSWLNVTEYVAEEIDLCGPRFEDLPLGYEAPNYDWRMEENMMIWKMGSHSLMAFTENMRGIDPKLYE